MVESTAYIGLGGNVGDVAGTLMQALRHLDRLPDIAVRRISNFTRTAPVGGPPDQPTYLNGVAEIKTHLPPQDLLVVLQDVERQLGRDRQTESRWGPRTCDLDILLIGDLVLDSETLTIPHPRMHERLFVLRPLATIAPDLVHPVLGKTVIEMLVDAEVSR